MPVELIRDGDDEPVAIRINGHEFACGEETYQTTIPKEYLIGIRSSEIPDDITIKPVESIKTTSSKSIMTLSCPVSEGEASAIVEEMFRRKFWDGNVGLTPYVTALREAIDEDEATC